MNCYMTTHPALSIYTSTLLSITRPPFRPFTRPAFRPSHVHPSVHHTSRLPSTCPAFRPFTRPAFHPSHSQPSIHHTSRLPSITRPAFRPFTRPGFHPFTRRGFMLVSECEQELTSALHCEHFCTGLILRIRLIKTSWYRFPVICLSACLSVCLHGVVCCACTERS